MRTSCPTVMPDRPPGWAEHGMPAPRRGGCSSRQPRASLTGPRRPRRITKGPSMRGVAPLVIVLTVAALPLAAQEPSARSREAQHAIAQQITQCTDDQRQFFATGLTRPRYLMFCNCYVHSALDAIDADEDA